MVCGGWGFWAPIAGWDGSVIRVAVSRDAWDLWILTAGGVWMVSPGRLKENITAPLVHQIRSGFLALYWTRSPLQASKKIHQMTQWGRKAILPLNCPAYGHKIRQEVASRHRFLLRGHKTKRLRNTCLLSFMETGGSVNITFSASSFSRYCCCKIHTKSSCDFLNHVGLNEYLYSHMTSLLNKYLNVPGSLHA